jgi:DNA-binding transcriptional LysR family regulator
MDDLRSSSSLLAGLLSFEAAARLGSFSRAAEALEVSQPAVSLRIRQLERRLGAQLFVRKGRGVALTTDGLGLWREVKLGLDQVRGAVTTLQRRKSRRDSVTVAVSSAFASYWLLPRVRAFQDMHPSIELRVLTSDHPVDLVAERIPLAVRHGDGRWAEYDTWPVAREVVFPVCAPRYLEQHGPVRSVETLAKHRLIDLHERRFRHLAWADWLREAGVRSDRVSNRLDFTDYALVVKAALAGDGIALGWQHLVGDLLLEGQLVAPVPRAVETGNGYWLIAPRAMPATTAALGFRDWLLAEAHAAERQYTAWRQANLPADAAPPTAPRRRGPTFSAPHPGRAKRRSG